MAQANMIRDGFTSFGGNGVSLELAPRTKVRLYLIAFKLVNKEGYITKPFNIKGRLYSMPRIGDFIEVDSVVAKDIQERLQIYDPKLGFVAGVTTDAYVARAVKTAFESGKLTELPDLQTIMQAGILGGMSDEALAAELERRNRLNEVVKDAAAENAETSAKSKNKTAQ